MLHVPHERDLGPRSTVFSPNELIRSVWAHPPQTRHTPRIRTGMWHIVTGLLRDGDLLNSHEAPRSWRWSALFLALMYQAVWCLALIWLMYVRFWIIPWAAPGDGQSTDSTIEVSFISPSLPSEATLPTPLPEPASTRLPTPLPEQLAPPPPPARAPQTEAHSEAPPTLVATEVDEPDSNFILFVPDLKRPEVPALATHDPTAATTRELVVTDIPLLQHPLPLAPLTSPSSAQPPEVAVLELPLPQREIPLPLPELELHQAHRPTKLPDITPPSQTRQIIEREIALSSPSPSPALSRRDGIDLTPPIQEQARPPVHTDTWDLPPPQTGASSSLLDSQGRPRLADSQTRPGGGFPPGTIVEDYANIDRMGTWLKRPPPGYQSSQLDQLWVPHENILEEWVRRSIKNIWIPIPGTNKVIRCTIVLLMLGGGCGVSDPNLQDISATPRPPAEVPFKPELHEDQESLSTRPEQHPDARLQD